MKENVPVSSLAEFIEAVDRFRNYWLPGESNSAKELWFRGEPRDFEQTRLCPQLYRSRNDEQALKPPLDLINIEDDLYTEFKRCAAQLYSGSTSGDDWAWDAYFLMQHHNGPTRMLDWSDGALMALHFAVRDATVRPKPQREINSVVWIMDSYRVVDRLSEMSDRAVQKAEWKKYAEEHKHDDLNPELWEDAYLPLDNSYERSVDIPKLPLLLHYSHITRRIAAQKSRMMIFGTDYRWLADLSEQDDAPLQRIIIDGNASCKIRRQLRDAGVTESVIYPDLDGLGREMQQLWNDRK